MPDHLAVSMASGFAWAEPSAAALASLRATVQAPLSAPLQAPTPAPPLPASTKMASCRKVMRGDQAAAEVARPLHNYSYQLPPSVCIKPAVVHAKSPVYLCHLVPCLGCPLPAHWLPRAPGSFREGSTTDPKALQNFPRAFGKPLRPPPATHHATHELSSKRAISAQGFTHACPSLLSASASSYQFCCDHQQCHGRDPNHCEPGHPALLSSQSQP